MVDIITYSCKQFAALCWRVDVNGVLDIISTVEEFHQYCGGYHHYLGGILFSFVKYVQYYRRMSTVLLRILGRGGIPSVLWRMLNIVLNMLACASPFFQQEHRTPSLTSLLKDIEVSCLVNFLTVTHPDVELTRPSSTWHRKLLARINKIRKLILNMDRRKSLLLNILVRCKC